MENLDFFWFLPNTALFNNTFLTEPCVAGAILQTALKLIDLLTI